MPVLYQFFHLYFLSAGALAFVAASLYQQYRTLTARCGSAFLLALGIELISYSWLWISATQPVFSVWYTLMIVALYTLPVLGLIYISKLSRSKQYLSDRAALTPLAAVWLLLPLQALLNAGGRGDLQALRAVADPALILGRSAAWFTGCYFAAYLLAGLRLAWLLTRPQPARDRKLTLPLLVVTILMVAVSAVDFLRLPVLYPVSVLQLGLSLIAYLFFFYIRVYKFGGILPLGQDSVFEIMRDGCILVDTANQVVDLNPAAETFLNCRRRDWRNRDFRELWPEIANEAAERPLDNTIIKIIPSVAHPDSLLTEVTITRFLGIYENSTGQLVSIRDITGRDQLEEQLLERNHILAHGKMMMDELAQASLVIQSSLDLTLIFQALRNHFARLDLNFFVAGANADGQLSIEHVSVLPAVVEQFEKAAGITLRGMALNRTSFSELYSYFDTVSTDNFLTTFSGKPLGGSSISSAVDLALRLVGIDPAAPVVVFRLTAGEDRIGLMGIWGAGLHLHDLNPLRVFTGQVAWAIERARLQQHDRLRSAELERSNQLVNALANVSAQMGRSHDTAAALAALGRELEAIGLHCVLGTVDDAEQNLIFRYASFDQMLSQYTQGLKQFRFVGYTLPRSRWPGTQVINEGKPTWYQDLFPIMKKMFPIPENVLRSLLKRVGVGAADHLCILPLVVDGRVTGVLPVWGKGIQEQDTPALMVFAHQVAEFLRKTEGIEQETARASNLERSNSIIMALSNVAAGLETTSNLNQVYQTLAVEMKKVGLSCMVGTLDAEKQYMKIEYLSIPEDVVAWAEKLGSFVTDEMRIPRHLWPTDRAVTDRVAVWEDEPAASIGRMLPWIPKSIFVRIFEKVGIGRQDQLCYLPIIIDDDVTGILGVWGPNLKDDDIPGLSVFANQVATAMKNAMLYNNAREEISIRKQAEERIQAALSEKEVLLKEIHHRVKNNLQVISSLLNLQMGQSKDEGCTEGLRESQNRVRAMALIHEKLYQSDDLARINLASYLNSLVTYLSQTYRTAHEKVLVEMEIGAILLDLDTAIPCGLIINELVSNALKYAFPDGRTGVIKISCQEAGEKAYLLSVEDNGVGLPAGLNPARSSSLGLKLVNSLVRQIGGELEVESSGGARFAIRFSTAEE